MSLSEKMCSQNSDSLTNCLVNELKAENSRLKEEICLLKTQLNEYKNEAKKQKRKSFSDCFCDDLCEEILQYLYLEDKLKLECVSKQFQRTVFQRQYRLEINLRDPEEHQNYLESKYISFKRELNYYSKFCLIARAWDRNFRAVQLKGVQLGKV